MKKTKMNICAIMIGRAGSKGFSNKNILKVSGKRLCEYPLIAAKKSKIVDEIYVSTDCKIIKKVSKKYGAKILYRPKRLASNKALGDSVFEDAYFRIKKLEKKIDIVILLFANAPLVTPDLIKKGVDLLKKNPKADSAVSVSKYNMWSPIRARKVSKKGTLVPFVPFKVFGNPKKLNCDRDSQGDVYFADMSVSIVRPKCLENLSNGLLPQKWMGQKILPIYSEGAFDIDYDWQLPLLKYWIDKNR